MPSVGTHAVAPDRTAALEHWLGWIESVHPSEIELGLARVARVAARLGVDTPSIPVVIVGGTNGKGSTVAMLEAIWTSAGYRTGAATSPHVTHFSERMRVAGENADESAIVRALARVDDARTPVGGGDADSLTYFEFATLASMVLFLESGCDVAIMEVGLGGRLDAVNLWNADCAVLTSIALDHADWLGDDLSVIATEKAAIGRPGRPLIIGAASPPASLHRHAREHGMQVVDIGRRPFAELPETSLPGAHQRRNAGCALATVQALADRLPVPDETARAALAQVTLAARFEERDVDGTVVVLDVAHNPAAAGALADAWDERFGQTRAVAVFAALADKDVEGIVRALAPRIAHWCCAALEGARALPVDVLVERVGSALSDEGEACVEAAGTVEKALARALSRASEASGPVLVLGSFVTVTAAHAALRE